MGEKVKGMDIATLQSLQANACAQAFFLLL